MFATRFLYWSISAAINVVVGLWVIYLVLHAGAAILPPSSPDPFNPVGLLAHTFKDHVNRVAELIGHIAAFGLVAPTPMIAGVIVASVASLRSGQRALTAWLLPQLGIDQDHRGTLAIQASVVMTCSRRQATRPASLWKRRSSMPP